MTEVLNHAAPPAGGAPRQKKWPSRLIPAVLMLLGALVTLYPVIGTYYNNYKQAEFAATHNAQISQAEPQDLSAALDAARAYNAALAPGLLTDPWSGGEPAETPEFQQYLSQLNSFDTMARVRIPEISVDQPVFHGTSEAALTRGVGHLFGSSLPVGGPDAHAVLTAHSGLQNATHFDRLHELGIGSVLYIDVYGETLAYEVDAINVVLPNDFEHLARVSGADHITLITCTPYGVNSRRLLVRAHSVPYDADADTQPAPLMSMDWSIQPWMWLRFAIAGLALLMLLIMTIGWIRTDRREQRQAKDRK